MANWPLFPGSAQEAGANLHNNAIQTGRDIAGDARSVAGIPGTVLGGFVNFLNGLATGNSGAPKSVTVPLPDAKPYVAPVPTSLGTLSPAAAAVLAHAAASTPAKAAAAPAATKTAAADPLGAFGNLSFRQLLTLSQASENLQQKGTTRAPTPAEIAGTQMIALNQPQFEEAMKATKDPAMKLKLQSEYTKNVLLPIMAHGNSMAGLGYDPSSDGN